MSLDLSSTLARLAALLGPPDGPPEPLDGGITNRNFKVSFAGEPHVIRVPGKDTELLGIDRNAEWAASCLAAKSGVGPPVRAMLEDPHVLVTAYLDAQAVERDDLRRPDLLRSAAAALRTIHDSGETLPSYFDPFDIVLAYGEIAQSRGAKLPREYAAARRRARAIEKALRGPEHEPVPCHNDLLGANLLLCNGGLRILDWEYAGMGDRWFDLGNFAVNNELDADAGAAFLEAYFGEPPGKRRLATLKLMRFMSDFREAMWGVVQSAVSEVDFDFEGYAAKHFARMASMGELKGSIKEARGSRS